jgi:hypothetical protein
LLLKKEHSLIGKTGSFNLHILGSNPGTLDILGSFLINF